jgi:hypothetical protein
MQRIPVRSARTVVPASLPNQSLSQRLHDLQAQTDVRPEQMGALFDALFAQHFGRPAHRKHSWRDDVTFGRVFAWCLNHDVNPEDFISANMLLLRPRLGRHAFRPNMLVGANAEARYNGVLGRANRRFGTGSMRVFDSRETWLGRIRANLATSELEVAELFCSLALADDPITWEQATRAVRTHQDWQDYHARVGCWNRMSWSLGRDGAAREGLIASLSAAWQLAEKHRHGLGDCIGVTDFSWPAFVKLLRHVGFGPAKQERVEFAMSAGGSRWGNW